MDWKKGGGKKKAAEGSCSFLMCRTKRMELTAVHNHLHFRHGGSCWEQIKPLKKTVKDFRSLAETRLSCTYRKVNFETIVTEIRAWRFCALSKCTEMIALSWAIISYVTHGCATLVWFICLKNTDSHLCFILIRNWLIQPFRRLG